MQGAGCDKAKPDKVPRTKVNLRGVDWWTKATLTQPTQRMTRHLWGPTEGMSLYMCLRSISQCFLKHRQGS